MLQLGMSKCIIPELSSTHPFFSQIGNFQNLQRFIFVLYFQVKEGTENDINISKLESRIQNTHATSRWQTNKRRQYQNGPNRIQMKIIPLLSSENYLDVITLLCCAFTLMKPKFSERALVISNHWNKAQI
jgi:hypothetical protein